MFTFGISSTTLPLIHTNEQVPIDYHCLLQESATMRDAKEPIVLKEERSNEIVCRLS